MDNGQSFRWTIVQVEQSLLLTNGTLPRFYRKKDLESSTRKMPPSSIMYHVHASFRIHVCMYCEQYVDDKACIEHRADQQGTLV